jgi:large subunit ribosomal protein L17
MRHKKSGRKLGLKTAPRLSMLRNLTTDLLNHEHVTTTEPKAKEIRRLTEKMITLGKKGHRAAVEAEQKNETGKKDLLAVSLHHRRQALKFIVSKDTVNKTFESLAERYEDRPGGYTRIIKLGPRRGDGAPMAMIQLV